MNRIQNYSVATVIAILGLFLVPTSAFAFNFGIGGGGDSLLFGYNSMPKAQLVAYGAGPVQSPYTNSYAPNTGNNSYNAYNPYAAYSKNYSYSSYGGFPQNGYYNYVAPFAPYYDYGYGYAPGYAPASYGYTNYIPYTASNSGVYNYAQYYGLEHPSQGYVYPNQVPGTDLWGNSMCNWGPGYGNFPCDRDPSQPVYDVYSGTWY